MSPAPAHAPWDAAVDWVHRALADLGVTVTGVLDRTHVTAWSTVARVPTDAGSLWFKQNGPGSRYEADLSRALGEWAPGRVVSPLAVAHGHGWAIFPDGGPTLRSAAAGAAGAAALPRWEEMLHHYAELQRDLVKRVGDLLALGVPDLRPERMPDHLTALLDDPVVWSGLAPERYAALRRLEPVFAGWCRELADSGIPGSLQHDDLHDANVFPVGGGFLFCDWGDASVAHPFASLLVTLRVAAQRFGLAPGDQALVRLRDAYLGPWRQGGRDRGELIRTAATAVRVGKVSRALAWQRALLGAGPEGRERYLDAVPRWVEQLLEPDLL